MSDCETPTPEVAHNQQVVADLRAGRETLGGMFPREAVMLLKTIGARTGKARTWPVIKFVAGGDLLTVASAAGRDRNPAWYHNVLANPRATVELWEGGSLRSSEATVTPARPENRAALWAEVLAQNPAFAAYQAMTERELPLLHVMREGGPA